MVAAYLYHNTYHCSCLNELRHAVVLQAYNIENGNGIQFVKEKAAILHCIYLSSAVSKMEMSFNGQITSTWPAESIEDDLFQLRYYASVNPFGYKPLPCVTIPDLPPMDSCCLECSPFIQDFQDSQTIQYGGQEYWRYDISGINTNYTVYTVCPTSVIFRYDVGVDVQ